MSSRSLRLLPNMAKTYTSYPMEYDHTYIPIKVGVKPVNYSPRRNGYTKTPFENTLIRPCGFRSNKEFDNQHYPLPGKCGAKKSSSQEILKVMDASRSCPTCCLSHSTAGPPVRMVHPKHLQRVVYITTTP